MFWENVFVREDFLSNKTSYKQNELSKINRRLGALKQMPTPHRILEISKIWIINAFNKYIFIKDGHFEKKKIINFMEFFEMRVFFSGKINNFKN